MNLTVRHGGDLAGDGKTKRTLEEVAEFERAGSRSEDLVVHFEDGSSLLLERASIERGSILENPVYPGPASVS